MKIVMIHFSFFIKKRIKKNKRKIMNKNEKKI